MIKRAKRIDLSKYARKEKLYEFNNGLKVRGQVKSYDNGVCNMYFVQPLGTEQFNVYSYHEDGRTYVGNGWVCPSGETEDEYWRIVAVYD